MSSERITIGPAQIGGLIFQLGHRVEIVSDTLITEGAAVALALHVLNELERNGSRVSLAMLYHAILERREWLEAKGAALGPG